MAFSSSSSTSIIPKAEYEVFLSFHGLDTRKKITSHLYEALCQKKIRTFIDDKLIRGEEISPSLLKAIKLSKISVIIFSKGYASSRWCLKELEKILKCKNKYAQVVIPIFYEVDPSDVRNQTGDFGNAFSELEERFKNDSERWRIALRDAANLSGFHSKDHRSDASLVNNIVDDIFKRLFRNSRTFDTKDLVGLDSSIEKIKNLLCKEGVRKLGIWGIGGIGKTAFAKAVFNEIFRRFEASFFIEDIRARSEKSGGLNKIRQKLSHALFGDLYPNIGFNFRSEWLRRKNVLIVFDDMIANDKQTTFLKEMSSCLNSESLLIITTREKQVLINCGVHKRHIYEMKELCFKYALQLFSLHAFGENRPTGDYFDLSTRIVKFCKGLPLALNVLGAHLFKKTREDWESALKNLEISGPIDFGPNTDILKVLKISYDGLTNTEKDLFLDIACFFEGYKRDRIEAILNAHGFNSWFYINDLIQRSLITESFGTIKMHDLLREMGRKIVQNESINDPGKRSRLWYHKDIVKVLQNNEGTSAIRSMRLDMSKVPELHLNPTAFDSMQNLRFLAFYGTKHGKKVHESDSSALCLISRFLEKICSRGEKKAHEKEDDMESYVTEDEEDDMESNGTEDEEDDMQNPRFLEFKGFEHEKKVSESDSSALCLILRFLEKICSWGEKKAHGFGALKFDFCELRYLSWKGYSAKSLPPKVNPKNLVALYMPNSKVEKLWTGNQADGKGVVIFCPGTDIPNWFTIQGTDDFIKFPPNFTTIGYVLCAVVSLQDSQEFAFKEIEYSFFLSRMLFLTGYFSRRLSKEIGVFQSDHVLLEIGNTRTFYVLDELDLISPSHIELWLCGENDRILAKVKKYGVRLFYDKYDVGEEKQEDIVVVGFISRTEANDGLTTWHVNGHKFP